MNPAPPAAHAPAPRQRLRMLVVWGVLIVFPLLALPQLNQPINDWLSGPARPWAARVGRPHPDGRSASERLALPPSQAALEGELRQLGAEEIDVRGMPVGYEASCQVPIASNAIYQRPFEGRGATPEAALQQLIEQVRRWKAANAVR